MSLKPTSHEKNKIVAYPYVVTIAGFRKILLWVDGGKQKDYFVTDRDGAILLADSYDDLRELCAQIDQLIVLWEESSELNLDHFWSCVRGLRLDRASSRATCESILNGWNFLEDLARTLQLSQELRIFSEELQVVYEKVFAGCNLPSMTPEGRQYLPLWTAEELKNFKSAIRELWQSIVNRSPSLLEGTA